MTLPTTASQPTRPAPSDPGAGLPARWAQGQHVAIVGDTGTGKTFLMAQLARLRDYVVVFRTKLDTRREPAFSGFRHVRDARAMDDNSSTRLVITPDYYKQYAVGYDMLERVWKHGAWTVVIDELYYVEQELRLTRMLNRLWTQGRSAGITVVAGMQRPSWISRFALSQCTHVFSFRVEKRDAKVLADAFTYRIIPLVNDGPQAISGHDFAYYNRVTRAIGSGNANNLGSVLIKA